MARNCSTCVGVVFICHLVSEGDRQDSILAVAHGPMLQHKKQTMHIGEYSYFRTKLHQ